MSDGLAVLLRTRKKIHETAKGQTNDVEQWPVEIKSFFEQLENWLSDLIEEKTMSLSYETKKIGASYSKRLKLKAGNDEIVFIPNKRALVGSTGKIVMKTKKGNMFLIRDRDGIWKRIISKSPMDIEILTKRNFRILLKSVLS